MRYFLILAFIFSNLSFSTEPPSESEFQLDKGLMEKLYQESVTESQKNTAQYSAGITVSPVLSLFTPTRLSLSNDYWQVPYGDGIGSVPGFSIAASGKFFNWGGLYVLGIGGVGYSMKEVVQKAYSKKASDAESTAKLTLHWLPLSLGSRVEYRISGFEVVRPFIIAKGGAEWLYQVGGLEGIEQGFWVPFLQYGGGLTLFDSPSSPDRWFGGLTLGISKHISFSSSQVIDGTVFDLGFNILL